MASDREQSSGAGPGWASGGLPGSRSSSDAGAATRGAGGGDGDLGAVGRDYYVRVAGNDYSVDPNAIGQLVDVRTTLDRVTVSRSGSLLASHDRCWAARQTLTDPAHVTTAAALRHQFQAGPPPATGDHLVRDLGDYDRAFGVDFTSSTVTSDGEVA